MHSFSLYYISIALSRCALESPPSNLVRKEGGVIQRKKGRTYYGN